MSEAMFDTATFLQESITESNSTEAIQVPVGMYPAFVCDTPEIGTWQSQDGTKSGVTLSVKWELQVDPSILTEIGRDKAIMTQKIFLDTEIGAGGKPVLSTAQGKNIQLGQLREAVGLNVPGQPFSLALLQGKFANLEVGPRLNKSTGKIIHEIKKVMPQQ